MDSAWGCCSLRYGALSPQRQRFRLVQIALEYKPEAQAMGDAFLHLRFRLMQTTFARALVLQACQTAFGTSLRRKRRKASPIACKQRYISPSPQRRQRI